MRAKIEIEMENAAFGDRPAHELGRILRVASAIVSHEVIQVGYEISLRDINGNTVGSVKIEDQQPKNHRRAPALHRHHYYPRKRRLSACGFLDQRRERTD